MMVACIALHKEVSLFAPFVFDSGCFYKLSAFGVERASRCPPAPSSMFACLYWSLGVCSIPFLKVR